VLPDELLACLDLEGLTAEPRYITDELFKKLIADVIYRVPIKGTDNHIDFFVITEHKSYNDFLTIFQLWGYVLHVIRQEYKAADDAKKVNADYLLPPVVAIILHHGESKFTGKTELSELFLQLPGIEKYLPKLQAILVDLNTIADDDVSNDPDAPELKLVLMALKLIFHKDASTKLTEILEESKSISDDPIFQDVVRMVWHYFVASAKYEEHDYNTLYNTIKKIVEVEPMPTMLERWTADAVAKERTMLEKRTADAVAKGKAELLLAILQEKFDSIPKETEQTILAMTDSVALQSWGVQASMCQSLEEFVAALE